MHKDERRQQAQAALDKVMNCRFSNFDAGAVVHWAERGLYEVKTDAAALSALVEEQPGVKALEWVRIPLTNYRSRAETTVGSYRVWTHREAEGVWYGGLEDGVRRDVTEYHSEEAAKSAAQSDYESRIRSALVDVPAVESEPVAFHVRVKGWGEELLFTEDGAHSLIKRLRRTKAVTGDAEIIPLYVSPVRSAIAPAPAEVVLSKKDAERIASRLEFDASWDKCGDGYYSIKRQLSALSPSLVHAEEGMAHGSTSTSKGGAE